MKLFSVLVIALATAGFSANNGTVQDGEDGPENSISDVMKKAHMGKDALMKKVMKDEASEEEVKQLIALYVDMLDNEPPKGEKEAWQMASGKVVVAATRVMLGQEGGKDALKDATNCKACHDAHKE